MQNRPSSRGTDYNRAVNFGGSPSPLRENKLRLRDATSLALLHDSDSGLTKIAPFGWVHTDAKRHCNNILRISLLDSALLGWTNHPNGAIFVRPEFESC